MPSCSQVRRCVICSGSHPARKRQVPTMCTGGNRNTPPPAATTIMTPHSPREPILKLYLKFQLFKVV